MLINNFIHTSDWFDTYRIDFQSTRVLYSVLSSFTCFIFSFPKPWMNLVRRLRLTRNTCNYLTPTDPNRPEPRTCSRFIEIDALRRSVAIVPVLFITNWKDRDLKVMVKYYINECMSFSWKKLGLATSRSYFCRLDNNQ